MVSLKEAVSQYDRASGVSRANRALIYKAVAALKPLWKKLGLHKPRVGLIHSEDDTAACYVSGTAPWPVILLEAESHFSLEEKYAGIISSEAHELIHAALELRGLPGYKHDEGFVEGLARDYCNHEITPTQVLQALERSLQWPRI